MSHSLSSQVHSPTAASASNVSPLHHSGSTTVKVAPRSVLVNWSESSRLNEGEEFPFDIFEAIALKAALDNPLGGYEKTDITVNFDNGHQHRCRVDLGCGVMSVGLRITVFVCSSTRYRLRKVNRRIGILLTPRGASCSHCLKRIS
nr:LPD25 domain-containing protein [Vibrio campbellii]